MQTIRLVEKEGEDLDTIRGLFREYAAELNEDLCFQSSEAEVNNPLKKYGEPTGCIMLALIDDDAAGCIALMPLPEAGACEMKRLYVRPAYRKFGLGRELISRLIDVGRQKGYKKMQLDTLQRLAPAISLYEQFGFMHTKPYNFNPIADVVYMEKAL
jgi:putative acetyltransferase